MLVCSNSEIISLFWVCVCVLYLNCKACSLCVYVRVCEGCVCVCVCVVRVRVFIQRTGGQKSEQGTSLKQCVMEEVELVSFKIQSTAQLFK